MTNRRGESSLDMMDDITVNGKVITLSSSIISRIMQEHGSIFIDITFFRSFAELSACIFLNEGIPVYLYGEMVPTPFVPFAISHMNLLAGVMVTASHNPKEDNGYKVYWSNGAQIISPHDKNIQASTLDHLKWVDNKFTISFRIQMIWVIAKWQFIEMIMFHLIV